MPYNFKIVSSVLRNGRTVYHATLAGSNEPKFVVGYRTYYADGGYGLYNTAVSEGQVYLPEGFEAEFGFWAYFIYPTAKAESQGSYNCLNTYDKAKFTFSFMQYAAHVPNGDFVIFLRKLLALPKAGEYFPKLILQNNRIHYREENGVLTQLETDSSTQALMDYLNPTLKEVENQELISAARMVHWASNDPEHRRVQVVTAIDHFKENMKKYHKRFNLHHAPAKVCLMVCDIRHQGRGSNDRIALALDTKGDYELAFTNLCSIGSVNYSNRINTVRNTINDLIKNGKFNLKYDSVNNRFVEM